MNSVNADEELRKRLGHLKRISGLCRAISASALPVGFIAFAYFSIQEVWTGAAAVVVITLFALVSCIIGFVFNSRQLKQVLGESVVRPVLNEIFEIDEYDPRGAIPRPVVESAELIEDWTHYSASDFFRGKYKGVSVEFSDVCLKREETDTDSEGNESKRYVTVFNGQWMICDFGKELAATVRIRENQKRIIGGYGKSKSSVETENPDFNEKFQILTSDGLSAFLLLTPHFMERILLVDEQANARSYFCFKDRQVHIALDTGRDFFELKGVKMNNLDNARNRFRSEIKYLTDIIDELINNKNLLKENKHA